MLDFILEGAKKGKGLITALAVYNITVAGGIICNDFFGEKNFFFFLIFGIPKLVQIPQKIFNGTMFGQTRFYWH